MEETEKGSMEPESAGPGAVTARRPGYHPSSDEERRLDRRVNLKMDLVVIFLLGAGFMFQGIDKSNIGNAATTAGFVADTHILPSDIPNSVSLFAATYIPCIPLSVALGRLVGPRWWIPALLFSWGAVTMSQAALSSRPMLYGLRLLLGACEAGYIPTTYYFVGTLYPAYMAGLRMGCISTSFALSGAFSSLIAYAIFHLRSPRWADWQLLFLVEGALTFGVALLCLLGLPGRPATAWFLSADERAHAARRMRLDTAAVDGDLRANNPEEEEADRRAVRARDVLAAFRDWRKMLIIVWTACATVPSYGFSVFLPLMVSGMGYRGIQANLMSVPPFMVVAVALVVQVWVSDRLRERSLVAAAGMAVSVVGYIGLVASSSNAVRYGFLFVVMVGAGSINPLSAAWLNDNTPDKATRAVVMGIYGWNNVAGVIAGQVYAAKYAPTYRTSLAATLGIVAFGMLGFVGSRFLYMLENKKRRAEIAGWTEEQFEQERKNPERRGHEKKYFMFGY